MRTSKEMVHSGIVCMGLRRRNEGREGIRLFSSCAMRRIYDLVFNFRRNEVRSFLLGAAYHWLRRYHIDGLRIDAVSSMLYKNHQKKDGEWLPNEHGGDANLQAISLLQELNWVVHKEFPGVFTMAEESTSWRGVTDKAEG